MAWDEKQRNLAALFIIMMILPTVAIILRAWSCIIKQRRLGYDDIFAFLSLPFSLGVNAVFLWWITKGFGRHASTVPVTDVAKAPLIIFAGEFLYDTAITLPKISALFFYNRIFEDTSRLFRLLLWTLGFACVAWLVGAYFSTGFQCNPTAAAWDPLVKGKCIAQWPWFLGTAVTSMVVDLMILLAPLPRLYKLRMPMTRKLFIIGVFLAGYSVIIVSIGRVISLAKLGDGYTADITWLGATYISWLSAEAPVSVISVSLPANYHFVNTMRQFGVRATLSGSTSSRSTKDLSSSGSRRGWLKLSKYRNENNTSGDSSRFGTSGGRAGGGGGNDSMPEGLNDLKIKKDIDVFEETV